MQVTKSKAIQVLNTSQTSAPDADILLLADTLDKTSGVSLKDVLCLVSLYSMS